MKIFFYLEFPNRVNFDFQNLNLGNPGIGGTEYATISLATELAKETNIQVTILSNTKLVLHPMINFNPVDSFEQAALAPFISNEFLVFRPTINASNEVSATYAQTKAKLIAWTHVTPSPHHLRMLARMESVKGIVALGNRQYFSWVDNPAAKKTYVIQNGQYPASIQADFNAKKYITYLGALVPQKGFHLLAEAWPKVISKCKDIELLVIGSGNLYNADSKLGLLNLADPIYEKEIIRLLGNSISSVQFLGKVSAEEKAQAIAESYIGIVNPTGATENCPAAALDFQAAGVPVISANKYGLIDTVMHNRTGILIGKSKHLSKTIINLFLDDAKHSELSRNARQYVRNSFDFRRIVHEWEIFLFALQAGSVGRRPRFRETRNVSEILALSNSKILYHIQNKWNLPSLVEYKTCLKCLLKR